MEKSIAEPAKPEHVITIQAANGAWTIGDMERLTQARRSDSSRSDAIFTCKVSKSMQPKININCTLGHAGSVSALFYVESETDVYGWKIEAKGHDFYAAFFMIENFYANRSTLLYRSLEDDVYGPWVTDFPPADNDIRCPLPEPVRHELERIQSKVVEEWLFFESDPVAKAELAAYATQQLPVHAVNVKSRKINRLEKRKTDWEHSTPGIDSNIIDFLQKYWRHDEKTMQRQSLHSRN